MHLILTGITGLVGSACLQALLTTEAVTAVTIISRCPVPMAEGHEKIHVILHDDFGSYPEGLLEKLRGTERCVWALGVSQNEVDSRFQFYTITQANVGEGATTEPGMFTPKYGKVKGQGEKALLELSKTTPSLKLYSARPAAVDATCHEEIHPFIPRQKHFMIRAGNAVLLPVFRTVYTKMVSSTKKLGQMLVNLALGDGGPLQGKGVLDEGRTISNVGIRRLARI